MRRCSTTNAGQRGSIKLQRQSGSKKPGVLRTPGYHFGGQGKALAFFQGMAGDLVDELGVEIVDGDQPSSTYFAAELRGNLAHANEAANRLALPFRFQETAA